MSRCCVHDFTSSIEKGPSHDLVVKWLKTHTKKWCFQLERSHSGYLHYQGRFSLKIKTYAKDLDHPFSHLSVTSKENLTNDFYVLKDETKVEGPWKDTDPYVPKSCQNIVLRPWQQHIVQHRDDDRTINVVVDDQGCIGKTKIARYMDVTGKGVLINFMKDYRDIMRCVYAQPKKEVYLIDIPRAIAKPKLAEVFAAIETLKDGYCFDDRYSFKKEWFEPPTIWIFTNETPNAKWLSKDRWKLWKICPVEQTFLGARFAPCNTRKNSRTSYSNSLEKSGLAGQCMDRAWTGPDSPDHASISSDSESEIDTFDLDKD